MKKVLALLLALAMVLTVFAACSKKPGNATGTDATDTDVVSDGSKPLVVGYSNFSSKFSPFFSETAYDADVWTMTSVNLLNVDRLGAVVEKGISVEPIPYNGTDYTYPGMSDLTITTNDDGTVDYDFVLRDGVTFSDGEPLTVDDVIFSMYVLSDPTYDGNSTFFSLPIEGMEEYRSGMDTLANLIFNAGRDNTDFSLFTEEQQKEYWEKYDASVAALIKDIVDYCAANGLGEDIASAAPNWGFDGATDEASFAAMLEEAYGADVANMLGTEAATISIDDYFPNFGDFSGTGIKTGDSAENISGITKTGDNSLRVRLTEVSAPAIYQLGVTITPMHYYGDVNKWNPDNGEYGFTFNDLSIQKSKTEVPRGAGAYVFESYKDKVVTFKANENWYKGKPIIETIKFKETASAEVATALKTGDADCGEMTGSRTRFEEVAGINPEGEITGSIITTNKVDNLGYGYIGLNADTINVGGNPSSAESKALRKAIATVLAVYRDVSFESYYGEAASVIQYPISNTSWAAPQASDPDYKIAFSEDPQGNPIYTASMSADDKYAAALEASLAWFEAAGYTVADGKLTAAPEGAKLDYEVIIPADGQKDHPSYNVLSMAREAFETIGFTLIINDPADSNVLWNALDSGEQEMWCAAWGSTIDPDMYQVYHGNNIVGKGGTDSNHYHINDDQLNQLIMDARTSDDQSFRKTVYKQCLDIIVDWAVEIPAYQRQNCIVFSTERINLDTLTPDITTFWGWMNDIEKLEMKYN